jgi:hypothetical protein
MTDKVRYCTFDNFFTFTTFTHTGAGTDFFVNEILYYHHSVLRTCCCMGGLTTPEVLVETIEPGCYTLHSQGLQTLQRKSDLCIPKKRIVRPQSHFLHSCVCERLLYFQNRSSYFTAAE